MSNPSVEISNSDRVTTITINRPGKRNALDDALIRELTEAFSSAARNNQSRIVVISGSGSSFCAGMDLAYLRRQSEATQAENLEDAHNLSKLYRQISNLKKPVIASVNGPALGGGCGLAAACDFVFAARQKARLGVPEVRLGFIPAVILVYLIKRMGEAKAREFVLRGDILDAETALSRGLVSETVEDEKLESRVHEFAVNLARSTSASSVALIKELFTRFQEMPITDALDYAANLNALARKTEDFKKGVNSFISKEKLEW